MNELKELETQLRSWAPRPPSAKLERRIFARPAQAAHPTAEPESPALSFRLSWLAPATLALLVFCIMLNPRYNPPHSYSSAGLIAVALSNQSAAAWLPGSFACGQNSLPAETFEWTNGSRSTSSISPLSTVRGTN